MANDPPFNTPRIVEVMDPNVNQHVVMVLMSTNLATKYPNKPWGTPIDQIGLAKRESDLFPGYVLVDFEPMKNSSDLFWIFQNLETSPTWTTRSNSRDNLIPAKFRGQVSQTKVKYDVTPETLPEAMSGDLISSIVEQQDNTGKALKITVTEVISENAEPLVGKQAYVERQIADTTEIVVIDGTVADSGLQVVRSSVSPLGNGKSIKETSTIPTWVELTASEWNDQLNAQIKRTEKFVAPPVGSDFNAANTSFQIVNQDRSLKVVEVTPTEALAAYVNRYPVRVNLDDLPRELLSINVVWNSGYSIGTQDYFFFKTASGDSFSLSKSADDSANSSASIAPEIQLKFRDIASRNLFGERIEIYLPNPITTAAVLAKLTTIVGSTVKLWPVFKPESETISTVAQSVSVSSNVQIGLEGSWNSEEGITSQGSDRGTSDNFQLNLNNGSVQIPPCIHGKITITGGTQKIQPVSATAFMSMFNTLVGSITATKTTSGTAFGAVSPTRLPAVQGPTAIPKSGFYLMDMNVRQFKYNYSFITVEVFNADNLA
jgi:hypothetical protein